MFFVILLFPALITSVATGVTFAEAYVALLSVSAALMLVGVAIAIRTGFYLTKLIVATTLVVLLFTGVLNFLTDYSVTSQRGCWEHYSNDQVTKICEVQFKGLDIRGETLDATIQKTIHQFRIETDDILGKNDFHTQARNALWRTQDTARLAYNRTTR
ncbi:MAG: hypothetical protein WBB28_01545 [Crinalium sp.]